MNLYRLTRKAYSSFMEKKRNQNIQGLITRGLKLSRDLEIISSFSFDPSHCFLISIGDNCTICPNLRLIAHDTSFILIAE
jgi:maltose O-acetyltransferase